jgi:hypothetical protein
VSSITLEVCNQIVEEIVHSKGFPIWGISDRADCRIRAKLPEHREELKL